MNFHLRKIVIAFFSSQILLFAVLSCFQFRVGAQERVISIVDAKTGEGSISLGSSTEPMPPEGYAFTVNVTLSGNTPNFFDYQVAISFEYSKVKCIGAWLPKNDPNFVFYNKTIIVPPGVPEIKNSQAYTLPPGYGYVVIGASLQNPNDAVTISQGILCQINFTVLKTGTTTLNIIPTRPEFPDTFLWDSRQFELDFSSQSFQLSVYAAKSPPIASFKWTPQYPEPNQTVIFDASESFDPDGEIISYYWDFGDGTNITVTSTKINYTYTTYGPKLVTLTVTDNEGQNSTKQQIVLVGIPPNVSFTYDWENKETYPSNPNYNTRITFNATESFDPDGNITQYLWNFTRLQFQPKGVKVSYRPADFWNETTTDEILNYTLTKNGVYCVTLTAFDDDGLYNSTSKIIFVGLRPIANFTWTPETPMPDQEVIFNAYQSETGEPYTYDEDGKIIYAIWDFYGIMEETGMQAYNVTKLEQLVTSFIYTGQGGAYTVNLTVFDDDGLYTSVTRNINVTVLYYKEESGFGWEAYAVLAVFAALIVTAVWYKKRPEKEPSPKERYRVI